MAGRRVLLVSYHFGEGCATGGFRWNAMTADLVERGWSFDVVALARPDAGLVPRAPDASAKGPIEVYPVAQPTWPSRLMGSVTGGLSRVKRLVSRSATSAPPAGAVAPEPDGDPPAAQPVDPGQWPVQTATSNLRSGRARVGAALLESEQMLSDHAWVREAVRTASELVRMHGHAAVVVSSPPHYTQTVGARVARRFGIPYVADFRDPYYYGLGDATVILTDVARLLRPRIERGWVGEQTVAVHNTSVAQETIGPLLERAGSPERVTIPNGYETAEHVGPPTPERFQVAFAGWLHPFMDIRAVMAGLARLASERELSTDDFRLVFMGTDEDFNGASLRGLAAAYGIPESVELRSRGPREAAMRLMAESSVLVAFDCIHPLAVPSKFYDYAQMCGRPLLIGNVVGSMADAAERLGMKVYAPEDHEGVHAMLDDTYRAWKSGTLDTPHDQEGIFHRSRQSERMAELLEEVVGPAGGDG